MVWIMELAKTPARAGGIYLVLMPLGKVWIYFSLCFVLLQDNKIKFYVTMTVDRVGEWESGQTTLS